MAEDAPLFIKILSVLMNKDNDSKGMTKKEIADTLDYNESSIGGDIIGMVRSKKANGGHGAIYDNASGVFKSGQLKPQLSETNTSSDSPAKYFIPESYKEKLNEYNLKDYVLNAINE